jgi:hypothetical protein
LELSAEVMVQLVLGPHWVLHEPPHSPVQVAAAPQVNTQPFVCDVHAPLPLRLQEPLVVHVHEVPVQDAGTPEVGPELEEPQATAKQESRTTATKNARMKEPPRRSSPHKDQATVPRSNVGWTLVVRHS